MRDKSLTQSLTQDEKERDKGLRLFPATPQYSGIFNRLRCKKTLKVYPDFHHYIVFDHVDTILPDVLAWLEEICSEKIAC